MKDLIRPNRPIGASEVSRLLQPEPSLRELDASRSHGWQSTIGNDPSRILGLDMRSEQVVQYGQMLVIRPLSAQRAAASVEQPSPTEAQTILVMVDSVAERDRIVRLLTERRDDEVSATHHGFHEARQTRPVVEYDELRIDFAAHRVSVDGVAITSLTTLEFRLLSTLVERVDCVQSRSTLLRDVWGVNANTATRTVDVHIKRLRDKIGSARRFIECVRGVGYRFTHTPALSVTAVTAATQANAAKHSAFEQQPPTIVPQ